MRALIWKEVREQVKWAMLWLIAIGLACGAALSAVSVRDWDNVSLLCSRLFYAVMLFGATLGGLLLGLLQTLPEARPGRWAFLMHRPLARPRIFGAKVCGGLSCSCRRWGCRCWARRSGWPRPATWPRRSMLAQCCRALARS